MYLLDTNVIFELRQGKNADPKVVLWAQTLPRRKPLYIGYLDSRIASRNPST